MVKTQHFSWQGHGEFVQGKYGTHAWQTHTFRPSAIRKNYHTIMIRYSTCLLGNPSDLDAEKKVHARAQVNDVLDINKFARHIANHGSVYSRADVNAILTQAVDCMREQLLQGNKVVLGELGAFSVSLKCRGAQNFEEFTANNIREVNVVWSPGEAFKNLREDEMIEFEEVSSRKEQAEMLKEKKA